MELGATYCAPSGTGIDPEDPLVEHYWSTRLGAELYSIQERGDEVPTALPNLCECPLCAKTGVLDTLELLSSKLQNATLVDNAKTVAHSCFPLAPSKPLRREEVLAVAVISCGSSWLMTRRPDNGLLAGQWEFPSACVWNSDKKNKQATTVIPKVAVGKRRKALQSLLKELVPSMDCNNLGSVGEGPLEHVFSHVRHTMWVDYMTVVDDENLAASPDRVRWMSQDEMTAVGVTSGVQKILKAVLTSQDSLGSEKSKKKRRFSKRR